MTPTAVLVLSTHQAENKPMVVTFDGKNFFLNIEYIFGNNIQVLLMTTLISNMAAEPQRILAVVSLWKGNFGI